MLIFINFNFILISASFHDRKRREVSGIKSACPLLLVADFRFHQVFGNGQPLKTANYMVSPGFLIISSAMFSCYKLLVNKCQIMNLKWDMEITFFRNK